jgi:hypothetical protein
MILRTILGLLIYCIYKFVVHLYCPYKLPANENRSTNFSKMGTAGKHSKILQETASIVTKGGIYRL